MTDEQEWSILTTITPTEDGRFARVSLELHKANCRVPIRVNVLGQKDVLYEQVQGELNNLLRQLINDLRDQQKHLNQRNKEK